MVLVAAAVVVGVPVVGISAVVVVVRVAAVVIAAGRFSCMCLWFLYFELFKFCRSSTIQCALCQARDNNRVLNCSKTMVGPAVSLAAPY